jgi:Zn-dependent M16 (insulinase) family peptidase
MFGFSSYRDPNTVGSLKAFRDALLSASRIEPDAGEFEKIVLAAAGKEDRPMAPGEKGFVALKRKLLGITDEQRQARRNALIECTPAELQRAAERLLGRFNEGATVFLTNTEAVKRDLEALQALKPSTLELPD